jgi:cephalosporin hydroxylase
VYIHTCIISRFSEYIPLAIHGHCENIYVVLHDLLPSGLIIPLHSKLKKIFCLTEWHVEYFTNIFPQCKHITVPFYYGINQQKEQKQKEKHKKEQYKFIYSSFPNRGLFPLLQMWPKIIEKYPTASLHIYSDIDGSWVNAVAKEQMDQIRQLLNEYKINSQNSKNIVYHGWVSKSELSEAQKTSEYWLYPCTFMETFCLTALESALYKICVITNDLAALQNTVGDRGTIITGDASTQLWQDNALIALFDIMGNKGKREIAIERNYAWATNLSWEKQANKLLEEHIFENILEYRGMLNWTNDLPEGTNALKTFKRILNEFAATTTTTTTNQSDNPIKILEIGTYSGTSLIEIVKQIPNSIGLGIDKWSNYDEDGINILQNMEQNNIEKSFHQNIKMSNMENRINSIKGDSSDVLLELLQQQNQQNQQNQQQQKFDIIYVDGSHKCLDVVLDLFLSWKLLRVGGLMIIDDYLYNINKVKDLPMEYPYEAVNHFLKRYENKYKLLDKGYRVFIQKI